MGLILHIPTCTNCFTLIHAFFDVDSCLYRYLDCPTIGRTKSAINQGINRRNWRSRPGMSSAGSRFLILAASSFTARQDRPLIHSVYGSLEVINICFICRVLNYATKAGRRRITCCPLSSAIVVLSGVVRSSVRRNDAIRARRVTLATPFCVGPTWLLALACLPHFEQAL